MVTSTPKTNCTYLRSSPPLCDLLCGCLFAKVIAGDIHAEEPAALFAWHALVTMSHSRRRRDHPFIRSSGRRERDRREMASTPSTQGWCVQYTSERDQPSLSASKFEGAANLKRKTQTTIL